MRPSSRSRPSAALRSSRQRSFCSARVRRSRWDEMPLHWQAASSDDVSRQFPAGTDRSEGAAVTEPERIRVVLVDDHGVVRRGLRGYLELLDDIEVVGEAENGLLGVELVDQVEPDVVLMDIVMPQLDGIGAIGQIKA